MISDGIAFSFDWEVTLMAWLQEHIPSWGISVLSFFSLFGEELLTILILGFLYWSYNKRVGKMVGLSVLAGMVWCPMIKNVVLRRRPYFDHEEIGILRVVEPDADIYDITAQGYSFPSGHSANASSLYGIIAASMKKRWMTVLAVVLPLLVGISRVTVGAHYPTDVLAGWLIGVVSMLLVVALQQRIKSTTILYGMLLITAIPGFFYCKSADYFTGVGLLIGVMGGNLLEETTVRFENTRNPIRMILRPIGGAAVYFALNSALKAPFPAEFLDSGTMGALLVRCVRYAVIGFVDFGVYPMLFRLTANAGGKKDKQSV